MILVFLQKGCISNFFLNHISGYIGRKLGIAFVSILFSWHCASDSPLVQPSQTPISELINSRLPPGYDISKTLRIYFGTNRKLGEGSASCSDAYYTTKSDSEIRYGYCDINVPFHHDIGNLDYEPDKGRDYSYLFQGHRTLQKTSLFESITKKDFEEVILFVHGFNVKFEEAVLRASQIKYDLKFSGDVVLFTWPAGAEDGLLNKFLINDTYKLNFQNAVVSRTIFKNYFLALKSTGKKVHLIVHSMGHQVVLPALNELYKETNEKFIEELVLNAPDFDSKEFLGISKNLKNASKRITVYCSPGDNALVASAKVNSNKRVGTCEKIEGIDMINVNPVDAPFMGIGGLGHGYYSSRPVLTDLYQVILGIDVSKRLFIRQSSPENSENYVLRR